MKKKLLTLFISAVTIISIGSSSALAQPVIKDTSTINKNSSVVVPLTKFDDNGNLSRSIDGYTMLDLSVFNVIKENDDITLKVSEDKINDVLEYHRFSPEKERSYQKALNRSLDLFNVLPQSEKEEIYRINKDYIDNGRVLTGIQVNPNATRTLNSMEVRMSVGHNGKGMAWGQGDAPLLSNREHTEPLDGFALYSGNNSTIQGDSKMSLNMNDNSIKRIYSKTTSVGNIVGYNFDEYINKNYYMKNAAIGASIRRHGSSPNYVVIGAQYAQPQSGKSITSVSIGGNLSISWNNNQSNIHKRANHVEAYF